MSSSFWLTSCVALATAMTAMMLLTTDADLTLRWAEWTTSTTTIKQTFQGKTVWITGASAGIGKALAYHVYHAQAGVLILSARREQELLLVKKELESAASSTRIIVLPLDLADLDALPDKVKQAKKLAGSDIDILFNNGGISQRSFAEDTAFDVDQLLMKVNLFAPIKLTKELLPGWLQNANTTTHRIINTVSLAGKIGSPLRTAYSASKFAMIGHFDCLRQELAYKHVLITNVCPGSVNTDISKNALMGSVSTKFASTDENIAHGMDVQRAAWLMLVASHQELSEVWLFGSSKERLGAYLNQYVPGLFQSILKRGSHRVRMDAEKIMSQSGGSGE